MHNCSLCFQAIDTGDDYVERAEIFDWRFKFSVKHKACPL